MIKLFQFLISIFLIIIIFLRIPQESLGLVRSSNATQRFLNILTSFCILIYFIIAIKLNIS